MVRSVEIHATARHAIRRFSREVRNDLGSALMKLQLGMNLGMPLSRPMPGIYPGAHELRFRDRSGIQRVFYYLAAERAILVFHAFTKKTQQTPLAEISRGRRRLKEMLNEAL